MKTIYKINITAIICIALFSYSAAHAQEFKTNESIKDQLKKGTVPGLKYGAESRSNINESTNEKPKSYTKENFRDLIFQGYSKQSSPTIARKSNISAKVSNSGSASLPSDSKAPEPGKTKVDSVKPPIMQGGIKEPVNEVKKFEVPKEGNKKG